MNRERKVRIIKLLRLTKEPLRVLLIRKEVAHPVRFTGIVFEQTKQKRVSAIQTDDVRDFSLALNLYGKFKITAVIFFPIPTNCHIRLLSDSPLRGCRKNDFLATSGRSAGLEPNDGIRYSRRLRETPSKSNRPVSKHSRNCEDHDIASPR